MEAIGSDSIPEASPATLLEPLPESDSRNNRLVPDQHNVTTSREREEAGHDFHTGNVQLSRIELLEQDQFGDFDVELVHSPMELSTQTVIQIEADPNIQQNTTRSVLNNSTSNSSIPYHASRGREVLRMRYALNTPRIPRPQSRGRNPQQRGSGNNPDNFQAHRPSSRNYCAAIGADGRRSGSSMTREDARWHGTDGSRLSQQHTMRRPELPQIDEIDPEPAVSRDLLASVCRDYHAMNCQGPLGDLMKSRSFGDMPSASVFWTRRPLTALLAQRSTCIFLLFIAGFLLWDV